MNKLPVILFVVFAIAAAGSCSDVKRDPGAIYMPDMTYSRAYETFLDHSNLAEEGIFYNNLPVPGTIARGEELPFLLTKDAPGDSTNYVGAKQVLNPLKNLSAADMKEAERLFLINCAICHGPKLDGNGPLYKGGSGPYPAQPANFVDPSYQSGRVYNMPEGQMFYSVTYGKNLMGSYASQLNRVQRWMVIDYIKSMQRPAKDSTGTTLADSTATAIK